MPGLTRATGGAFIALAIGCWDGTASAAATKSKPTVFDVTLEEQGQGTPELSTEEFKAFVARNTGPVFDARPRHEFAIAHIPGSISIDERGLIRLVQAYPDRGTEIVVYSNGPYCDWARTRAQELVKLGYTRIWRYQLGLSYWRALGHSAETTLEGFRRVLTENSAVIVDARSRTQYTAGSVPAAVSVQPGEAPAATQDSRLKFFDHSIRMLVFANHADKAKAVADEISRKSYSNVSYFGGSYRELKGARLFQERKPIPSTIDGLSQ